MVEYLFPIFGFGVVITGIVLKGMMAAAEVARNHPDFDERDRSLSTAPPLAANVRDLDRAIGRSQFHSLS